VSFLFININHDVGYESSESIPISLGYIVANLQKSGMRAVILDDLRDRPLSLRNLEKWILRLNPKVIGFTAYQSTIDRIRFFCRFIKSRRRKILTVLGGPQIVGMPMEALEALEDVDILVRGEGEIVMQCLSKVLAANESLEKIDGMAFKENGRIIETTSGPKPPDDLDEYPSPYTSGILNLVGKNTAILLSSRGCKHVCWFCITPQICKGKIRFHSIERVISEMEMLTKAGINRFWFADPNFTENRERTEQLLEEKMRRNIKTPFWFQTRTDLIDSKLMEILHRAGADTVAFGLESGSPGVLEKTNKGIILEQLTENIKAAQSLGIETELFTIFGLPGETIDNARETLQFVKSLGIPIQSNSGSQQMQLYFGSLYERNPKGFGIKPVQKYKPTYYSVGENYETSGMSAQDIRKTRNMWTLANEQMEQDVYYKQRTFEILDFLLTNEETLNDDPAFYAYGALASSAIEEFQLLIHFLEGYSQLPGVSQNDIEQLISALNFFIETRDPAEYRDRIIFDSRSWIDGVPFTGISGKYWDVLLGRGLLLKEFESGFLHAKEGDEVDFSFVFPDDYVQEELRGKHVDVHAKIHKVFKSPEITTLDQVRSLNIDNNYNFNDLDLLREQNEILYYFALRDSAPEDLLRTPSHFLMLSHKYAKLAKQQEIAILAKLLEGKLTALNALADTLVGAGKYEWALQYYKMLSNDLPSTALKQVRCYLNMQQPDKAMELIENLPEGTDLEFQETLLQCLKAARPESSRIPSLEHHVLDLRVASALGREAMGKQGMVAPPIVHGYVEKDEF
jgi:anaerobic magnesium-protoporphyrin IX monomethyl ester cyclase